jgi:PIN domain nuclease of toxin-antitoxin system
MKILLDTHAFFWWVTDNPKLSPMAHRLIEDRSNEVFVSAVVVWEMAIKGHGGKWEAARPIAEQTESIVAENGFMPLAISLAHAGLAGSLPGAHRDPFDRLLAAQATFEGLSLVTADRRLSAFGVEVLW